MYGYEDVEKAIKEMEEDYARANPPDFVTHSNYIEYLTLLSHGINLIYTQVPTSKFIKSKNVEKKVKLVRLTLENIRKEYETIKATPDFAVVCVCWIPVKSYYMLFNLLMILRYLITGQEGSFSISHIQLLREFIEYLDRGDLKFSEDKFNIIHNGMAAHNWKPNDSSNHVKSSYDPEMLYLQVIKKLQNYKEEDYKMKKGIKTLRSKANKAEIEAFRIGSKVGIIEFLYWYRIKANYRDLEFLDKDIGISKFVDYYANYYSLTINLFTALKILINKLSLIRFNEEIVKY